MNQERIKCFINIFFAELLYGSVVFQSLFQAYWIYFKMKTFKRYFLIHCLWIRTSIICKNVSISKLQGCQCQQYPKSEGELPKKEKKIITRWMTEHVSKIQTCFKIHFKICLLARLAAIQPIYIFFQNIHVVFGE